MLKRGQCTPSKFPNMKNLKQPWHCKLWAWAKKLKFISSRDNHDHGQPKNNNACVSDAPHPPTPPKTTRTNSNDMPRPIFYFSIKNVSANNARQLLGVERKASRWEIILKHRTFSRKHHPDKWTANRNYSKEVISEKFKVIANTRVVLLK